ncbi:MAG: AAA family ATPase, partial [Planctomycetota bacterium]
MAVLTDTLEWSADRAAWQRDALRRIVTQGSLTEQDVQELCKICLAQRGIADENDLAPAPNPLAAEHLPSDSGQPSRVQLVGLRDVQGVNALAPNQQVSFQLDGLTIVFGYNGSGKSGYARVLRSLCHARHRGDRVLQDVFADGDRPTPSATVDFNIAGSDRSEMWQEGQNPPAELGQVSFFDADCAAVHVNEVNELAFTPFGLDVLPKLATVCGQVHESIDVLVREQERSVPASL